MKTTQETQSTRRNVLWGLGAALAGAAAWRFFGPTSPAVGATATAAPKGPPLDWRPLSLSKDEWKKIVSAKAFYVLFEEGTERAYSSPLNEQKKPGTYVCAACYLPLFTSDTKFDSGTGWPSFYEAIDGRLGTSRDFKLILPRTEYHCARCGGHQGHVFDDGPKPTGLRYCNNGVALEFVPEGEPLPALRQKA